MGCGTTADLPTLNTADAILCTDSKGLQMRQRTEFIDPAHLFAVCFISAERLSGA